MLCRDYVIASTKLLFWDPCAFGLPVTLTVADISRYWELMPSFCPFLQNSFLVCD